MGYGCINVQSASAAKFDFYQGYFQNYLRDSTFNASVTEDSLTVVQLHGMIYGTDCLSLAIDEASPSMNIDCYPNPSTGIFALHSDNFIELVQVYNLLGELSFQKNVPANYFDLDLSSAESGLYILKITNKNNVIEKRIIKE